MEEISSSCHEERGIEKMKVIYLEDQAEINDCHLFQTF